MADATPILSSWQSDCTPLSTAFPEFCQPIRPEIPLPGRVLDGCFTIEHRIDSGGMSTVYLATSLYDDNRYAVKVLRPDLTHKLRKRFFVELTAVRRIDHPAVVKMYAIGELSNGQPYLVMEYVDGPPLTTFINHNAPFFRRALPLIRSIAEGIRAAHREGVIHRDLKPSNILLPRNPSRGFGAKVVDFGLARITDTPRITTELQVIGTPKYLSPEQAIGRQFDHRCDIYSLGVIMYEMFTGALPFKARSAAEIIKQHVKMQPPPIRACHTGAFIPPALEKLTMSCLAKSPDRRPHDMDEFLWKLSAVEMSLTSDG